MAPMLAPRCAVHVKRLRRNRGDTGRAGGHEPGQGGAPLDCPGMSPSQGLADAELRRLRMASQLLDRAAKLSAAQLVQHLGGVQAQVLAAAGLALGVRTRGLKLRDVEQARLKDRSVVLTWAMRGTLHLVPAEDHGWLVPILTGPRVAGAHRRLRQEGVLDGQPALAMALIGRMLEDEGPLTRREIAARLRRRDIRVEGQAIAHLMWLAAAQGLVCHGPDRDGEHCFVLARDWLGRHRPVEREAAMAELTVRYLRAHQPAAPPDLAAWSGLGEREAARCWRLVEDRLLAVESARGTLWTLRGGRPAAPPGLVRLLPSFDEYLLGWRDRSLSVAPEQRGQVNRGGGWLHPVLLVDGRVQGTWRTRRKGRSLEVRVTPFTGLAKAGRDGARREGQELSAYLGERVETAFA